MMMTIVDYEVLSPMLSCFNCVQSLVTLWTVACQAPLSMGFSEQEYCSVLPCILQGIFLTQGSNSHFLISCIGRRVFFTTSATRFDYLRGISLQVGTPLQHSCLENPMDGGAW